MIGEVQATQPSTMASEPVSIFFSYSRKDEALMRELESHLEPLRLSHLIESWHDGCITPGEEWEPQIKENLQKAQIILLLISVNFISSKYCNTVELTQAIKRHKSGDALVIPLILKPCMWQPIPIGEMTLGELQALPKDAKPVTSWNDRDEAYTNIAEGLYDKILQVQQEREAEAERQRQGAEAARRRQREQEEAQKLAEAQQQKQTTEDDLSSEKSIDYTRLQDLLKAQDWEAADQETYEVMIEAVGKKSGDWFTSNELMNFPCVDLLTIDRLWVKYSQGRFGFSVQKQIYVECGAKLDGKYPGNTVWRKFGDKVGWRVNGGWIWYADVTFSTSAPQGHLPARSQSRGGAAASVLPLVVCGLFYRIETC